MGTSQKVRDNPKRAWEKADETVGMAWLVRRSWESGNRKAADDERAKIKEFGPVQECGCPRCGDFAQRHERTRNPEWTSFKCCFFFFHARIVM